MQQFDSCSVIPSQPLAFLATGNRAHFDPVSRPCSHRVMAMMSLLSRPRRLKVHATMRRESQAEYKLALARSLDGWAVQAILESHAYAWLRFLSGHLVFQYSGKGCST